MATQKHRKRKKQKKPFEFSKCLFIGISLQTVTVTALAIVYAFKYAASEHASSDIWAVLIPATYAEQATVTGFYMWKAKEENKIKLRAAYGEQYNDSEEEC